MKKPRDQALKYSPCAQRHEHTHTHTRKDASPLAMRVLFTALAQCLAYSWCSINMCKVVNAESEGMTPRIWEAWVLDAGCTGYVLSAPPSLPSTLPFPAASFRGWFHGEYQWSPWILAKSHFLRFKNKSNTDIIKTTVMPVSTVHSSICSQTWEGLRIPSKACANIDD